MATSLIEQPPPAEPRRTLGSVLSRAAVVLGVFVAVIGLVGAVLVATALHSSESRDSKATFESSTALLALQLTSEVARYVDATTSLAASFGTHDVLNLEDFNSVTEPLPAALVNGIESVSYVIESG